MAIFTPQERRAIYIIIGILAVGSSIYFYKLKNPYFAPELDKVILEMTYNEDAIDSLIDLSSSPQDNHQQETVKPLDVGDISKININAANKEELMLLPGIGPVYAEKILEYRRDKGCFKDIEEIMNIKGIGEKKFEKIKERIIVD